MLKLFAAKTSSNTLQVSEPGHFQGAGKNIFALEFSFSGVEERFINKLGVHPVCFTCLTPVTAGRGSSPFCNNDLYRQQKINKYLYIIFATIFCKS